MPAASSQPAVRANRRSDKTLSRLLESGLRTFARYGYDGVSTRKLADAAKVNISAIKYYFGGKQGYYLAVARHIVEHHAAPARAVIAQVHAELDAAGDHQRAVAEQALEHLLHGVVGIIVPHQQGPSVSSFILREQNHPTAAFDIIYEGLMQHMHRLFSRLVGLLTDRAADDPLTILRAHALLGQVLLFQNGRTTLWRRMGWDRYTPERVQQIAETVTELAKGALANTV